MSIYVNGKKAMEEINHDLPSQKLSEVNKTQIAFANNSDFPDYPVSTFGKLLMLGGQRPTQLFFPHPDYNSHVYWRQAPDNQNYTNWNALATLLDINALQSQIDDLKKQIGGGK